MSISYAPEKIKKIVAFGVIFALVVLLAYGLFKISAGMGQKGPVSVIYPKNAEILGASAVAFGNIAVADAKKTSIDQRVVASKKGTKYHLLSCPGAKTISPENKIIFPNAKAAEKAGFGPAKNCKDFNQKTE